MLERRDVDFPSETILQKWTLATDGFSGDPSVWICQTMSLAMRSKTPTFYELVKTSDGVNIGWECQEMGWRVEKGQTVTNLSYKDIDRHCHSEEQFTVDLY